MKKILAVLAAFLMLASISPAAADTGQSDATEADDAIDASEAPERLKAEDRDIVGGFSVSIDVAPYQVALFSWPNRAPASDPFFDQICGGSLIHREWVVTAAHCVDGVTDLSSFDIGVGKTNLSDYTSADRYDVAEIIVHPDWQLHDGFTSDIALLKLTSPVTLSSNVAVIGLDYDHTAPSANSTAFTSGWGAVQEVPDPRYPDNLQGANLTIRTDLVADACGDWNITEFQAGIMTCASADGGGVSACFGDSGGPLVTGTGTPKLWGIVSFGSTCGSASLPAVYTRAPAYRGWIAQYVDGIDCDFTGTSASETVRGTNGNDVICGLGGDDYLVGYDGDDIIFGGDGADDMRGGPGNDVIFGEKGKDGVRGNKGDDYLYGGKGNDLIAGAKGNDVGYGHGADDEVYGGPGLDLVDGGPGNDFAKGGLADDIVFGGDGNDRLAGNNSNDQMYGGAGNDEIFGGPNSDYADGGSGTDRCVGVEQPVSCET